MATILSLAMKISANTAGISKGAKDTAKKLTGIKKSADTAASAMKTLVGIEVGKILAQGFVSAARSAINYANALRDTIDRTAKLANQTGIGVEALQGFAIAASLGGTDLETFANNVKRLTVRVGRLAESGKTEVFEKLGIDFQNFQSLAPEEQFKVLAKAVSGIQDPAEKARIAVELFGKAGAEMLPMLNSDFAELQERLEKLGVILSADQTSAIEEMNDALTLVQATFDGIIGQVTANLAPIVTAMAEDLLTFIEGYQGLGDGTGGTALADSITTALFDGAEYLAGIFDYFIEQVGGFAGIMQGVAAVFEFTANVFTAVAETLRTIFNVFEMIGNAIMLGLGKILEGLGSWVSSDLEQAGRDLAASATTSLMQNATEAGEAAVNAFNAGLGDRNFGREGGDGEGMASGAVRAARERYENRGADPAAAAEREKKRAEREAAQKAAEEAAAAEKAAEEQRKIEEKRQNDLMAAYQKFSETSQELEQDRLDKLSENTRKALEVSDIRSGGIGQIIAMATGREDPAVQEARKQLRKLEDIQRELRNMGGTVEIVGVA